jgi:low temperature requirement protein LtrA
MPIVAGIGAASAGLHLAILDAHGGGAIGAGPRAALYGVVSLYLLASAILPSRKLTWQARAARLTTSLAAMGLVFMGAFVVPVYLVPALAAVLALGLIAEAWLRNNRRRATSVWNPHRFRGERHARHWPPGPAPGPATADLPQGSES